MYYIHIYICLIDMLAAAHAESAVTLRYGYLYLCFPAILVEQFATRVNPGRN